LHIELHEDRGKTVETVDNNIRNFSCFDQIILPLGWQEKKAPNARGDSFLRAFSPPDDERVEIAIFFDGKILSAPVSGVFRTALGSIPRTVYDTEPSIGLTNDERLAVRLSAAMGNAGNNQLSAQGSEWCIFNLQRLEISVVSEAGTLHFSGFFHNEAGVANSYYEAYLFDGTPDDSDCRVHELYFKAPDQTLFAKYRPQFVNTVRSISITKDSSFA
jgi:hypothetical protein